MKAVLMILLAALLSACSSPPLPPASLKPVSRDEQGNYQYRLAAADVVSIFVWRNDELSGDYTIQPDGKLNMALTKPVMAEGLTTTELERVIQALLGELIKSPKVSIVIRQARGATHEHVRIIGTGATPYSTVYTKGMTLIDVITAAGGLSPYASGNRAVLIRTHYGKANTFSLRIDDLMENGDLSANVALQPGDVIRIPQAWF